MRLNKESEELILSNDWKIENIEELESKYDSRKSFYGKANILYLTNGIILLVSYETIVAKVVNGIYTSFGKWSQTTTRHQNEFKKQFAL